MISLLRPFWDNVGLLVIWLPTPDTGSLQIPEAGPATMIRFRSNSMRLCWCWRTALSHQSWSKEWVLDSGPILAVVEFAMNLKAWDWVNVSKHNQMFRRVKSEKDVLKSFLSWHGRADRTSITTFGSQGLPHFFRPSDPFALFGRFEASKHSQRALAAWRGPDIIWQAYSCRRLADWQRSGEISEEQKSSLATEMKTYSDVANKLIAAAPSSPLQGYY